MPPRRKRPTPRSGTNANKELEAGTKRKRTPSPEASSADRPSLESMRTDLEVLSEKLKGKISLKGKEKESEDDARTLVATTLELARKILKMAPEEESESPPKKRKTFSTVTKEDLNDAGIASGSLLFNDKTLAKLVQEKMSLDDENELKDLQARLLKISQLRDLRQDLTSKQIQNEAGSRILVDAILLAVASMTPSGQTGKTVGIITELAVSEKDGVKINSPAGGSRIELRLSGRIDYVTVGVDESSKSHLLGPSGSEDAKKVNSTFLLLLEAKRPSGSLLNQNIPEAAGQALAVMEKTRLPADRVGRLK
ncbi:hypothetical protein Clacol_004392 [Clathrus columnatus]|uniref:Uncharacterized protein n=1 Tax=Clathrus columnatus TaxID=1419009 RepID=A0AAV5AAW3_9AGAM|nr:hypothetical protein Clacol_004392 [Clathrus columnatus]